MADLYRFEDVTIDPVSFRLLRREKALPIEPKALHLLIFLVEHRGRLVERRELLSVIWGDAFVTDHVLNRSIGQLRKILLDDAKDPRFIETVPTLGYRFIAEVQIIHPATLPDSPEESGGSTTELQLGSSPDEDLLPGDSAAALRPAVQIGSGRYRILVGMLVVLLIVVSAGLIVRWRLGAPGSVPIRSLAVLPLENLSGDPAQDYLADGMTDQLIANLGQIGALRVVSQTTASQYKKAHKPLPQIARELNVDAVVEGSVLRSGDQLRIVAQLVNATTEKQLWSHAYDGELSNALELENQVASGIAEQVRVQLTQDEQTRLTNRQNVNPQAYEAFLKGNYFFEQNTGETTKKSLQYFKKAIQLDPDFARAYVGIARSFNFLGDETVAAGEATAEADAAIAKALQLQPDLAAAYAERGWTSLYYHWDFPGAERDFRHALELDPGLGDAHAGYGDYLMVMSRFEEGLREMKEARDLSPLSPLVITDYCKALMEARRYDEAQKQCLAALELDPHYKWALDTMTTLEYLRKDYPQAHAMLARFFEAVGETDPASFAMADEIQGAPGATGAFDAWLKIQKDPDPFLVAAGNAGLGRKDEALAWLGKAYSQRMDLHAMTWLAIDPQFDSLRSDPRFDDFLRHVGLPPQHRSELLQLERTARK